MFARTISTPLETDVSTPPRPQRMDRVRSSRIEKAREFVRRELKDMQLPSSCASAPQVDAERCALTFAPENEDPDQVGVNRSWRKTTNPRRREVDSPVCIICISNLPKEKDKNFYEKYLKDFITDLDSDDVESESCGKRRQGHLGPIFPKYGSVFLSFWSKKAAFLSFRLLQEEMPNLRLNILPNINTQMIQEGCFPLLIFVNAKSGGGQGKKVLEEFRFYFSRYQVFELDEGGPLPGLFAYRHVEKFRILACGGDGTVGWVLQCIEDLTKYMTCKSPPLAILPLGTGNDLSRVLGWSGGYTNQELVSILVGINNGTEVELDRWNILFDSYRKCTSCQYKQSQKHLGSETLVSSQNTSFIESSAGEGSSSDTEIFQRQCSERAKFQKQQTMFLDDLSKITEDSNDSNDSQADISNTAPELADDDEKTKIRHCDICRLQGVRLVSMSNYMGIGLDADITLEFHQTREAFPDRFQSRMFNKTYYFKSFLSQIPSKSKYINNVITLKAENRPINLPNIQGLIFINIPSWCAGADIWKVPGDKSDKWKQQDIADGKLECVGLTGLTHLSNVFAGIRSGIRIAQASYFRLNLLSSLTVQVDGEPWEQPAGEMVIAQTGLQAKMLKKSLKKRK